jgi:hypothetical protein
MAWWVVWQTPHPLFVIGAHDSVEKSCAVPAIWANPPCMSPKMNNMTKLNRNFFMFLNVLVGALRKQ